MIKVLLGEKGSGKTKKLVDLVIEAVNAEKGDVVVLEKDRTLTYDIPYAARLVDAGAYSNGSYDYLKGILFGLHSGNYDISYVFIDNFFKLVNDKNTDDLISFIAWLKNFSEKENIEFIMSVSAAAESLPQVVKDLSVEL